MRNLKVFCCTIINIYILFIFSGSDTVHRIPTRRRRRDDGGDANNTNAEAARKNITPPPPPPFTSRIPLVTLSPRCKHALGRTTRPKHLLLLTIIIVIINIIHSVCPPSIYAATYSSNSSCIAESAACE